MSAESRNRAVSLHQAAPAPFTHYRHAHCESGVTTNLLRHAGIAISEPMAFGIGAGLFFGHLPLLKVGGTPGTTFRIWPGGIFKQAAKRLGATVHTQRFSTPQKAMDALDAALDKGIPVGVQASVYYLPFLPEALRFHFNAHNLVIVGRDGDEYIVSDPVMEDLSRIHRDDLIKARFAKGTPEPRGFMYYITSAGGTPDFKKAILKGIRQTARLMIAPPLPWFGVKAIFFLAKKIAGYPKKLTQRKATLYLANIIRMQEEVGTGGAGFRYLYAAFLQEAGELLKREELLRFSEELTAIGDAWRAFAYDAARIVKRRGEDVVTYEALSGQLRAIGELEKSFFRQLARLK